MGQCIWFVISRSSLAAMTVFALGCQTTGRSLAAKSAPAASEHAKTADSCQRARDSRADCDDAVGCVWDNDIGQCTAH